MAERVREIESEVISTFADTAGFLGYSEVHGKILAALLISQEPISLEELAKKTRYSISMISLSLDLLEVLGAIKRIKKPGDRKLYIKLSGDLLKLIRAALLVKLQKGLNEASSLLAGYEDEIVKIGDGEKEKLLKSLKVLETEIGRMSKYISKLAEVPIPK
jgi:DNA-binding transcriptional regulator GbsR (MarR family)